MIKLFCFLKFMVLLSIKDTTIWNIAFNLLCYSSQIFQDILFSDWLKFINLIHLIVLFENVAVICFVLPSVWWFFYWEN